MKKTPPPAADPAPVEPDSPPADTPPAAEATAEPEPDSPDAEREPVSQPEPDSPEAEPSPTPTEALAAEFAGDDTQSGPAGGAPITDAERYEQFAVLAGAVEFLGTLIANRYGLYLFPGRGLSSHGDGPFYSEALAEAAVQAGFAYFEPSGGNHGSVKITDAGRAAYKAIRQAAPADPASAAA